MARPAASGNDWSLAELLPLWFSFVSKSPLHFAHRAHILRRDDTEP